MRTRIAAAIMIGCCAAVRAQESPARTPPKPGVELTAVNPPEVPAPLPLGPDAIAPVHTARPPESPAPGAPAEKKGLDFIAAPIPISNPTLGVGLAGVAAILFPISREDRVSPPATVGVGGFFTDNQSWALGAAGRFYLAEDHWRVLAGFAKGDIHYKLAPAGTDSGKGVLSVAVEQPVTGVVAEVLRRVAGALFVGARYTHADTTLRLENPDEGSGNAPPARDRSVTLAALGLRIQTDSRDSTFYPARGALFDLTGDFYDTAFGGTRSYQSYKAAWNGFYSMRERGVLGARVSACNVRGDAPIYGLCLFGEKGDLRGYEVGRFLDRTMWAAQAEYRWSLPERRGFFGHLGFVGFAGVGEVARSFSDLNSEDLLPGVGVGVRYLLSRQNHINFRIDYAWGKAGNRGVHVGVGEAF